MTNMIKKNYEYDEIDGNVENDEAETCNNYEDVEIDGNVEDDEDEQYENEWNEQWKAIEVMNVIDMMAMMYMMKTVKKIMMSVAHTTWIWIQCWEW